MLWFGIKLWLAQVMIAGEAIETVTAVGAVAVTEAGASGIA